MKLALTAFALIFLFYLLLVLFLYVSGRRSQARSIGGFIPDCVILFKNLIGDKRVPRRYKFLLVVLIGYLASPIDLIPDFIPVAGQLDDAIIVALVLRMIIKGAGKQVATENWPGPEASLKTLFKLARVR